MKLYCIWNNPTDSDVVEATDEEILAHPAVVAAIEKARNEAFDDRFTTEKVKERVRDVYAANPEMRYKHVRCVRHVAFEGSFENVAQQIARSLPAGTYGHRAKVIVEDGGIMPWLAQ
jgi:hypothetical protein